MAKDLAVILNNGSINSAVVTAMAAQKYRPIMVFAETSANVASRAKAAYEQQVSHFKPYREHTIPLPFLSVLQPPGEAQAAAADPRHSAMLPSQLIRLLPLVSSAAAFAAHYQAAAVYVGLRIGPNPDDLARATEYFQIFNELLQIPCAQGETEIIAPLL